MDTSKNQTLDPIISKSNLLTFCLILGLVYLFGGCRNERDGEGPEPEPTETIFQLLQTTPGLDSMARYVQFYPDIVNLINSSGSLTLFAPSNTAFKNLLNTEGFPGDITQINADVIKGVLFYHLVIGSLKSEEMISGEDINTLYPGETIRINSNGTLKTGSSTNPNIKITQKDIQATNGYIHIVGDVLIPPAIGSALTELTGTVAGTILLFGDFSTLANAILKADSAMLSGQTPLLEILRDQEVTIFAPPDAAFRAVGLEANDLTGSQWRVIIQYHIIPGTVVSSNLTQRAYTTFEGEDIYNTRAAYINGFPIAVADAIPAANGTLHVLGGILRPGLVNGGDIVQVITFQGFDSLAVALQLTGLDAALAFPNGPFTIFVPPNEAFVALLASLGASSLSEIPLVYLSAILAHHVVDGVYYSSDFADGESISTTAGIDVTIHVNQESLSATDGVGTTSPVAFRNLTAINGVIHVVSGILIPQ